MKSTSRAKSDLWRVVVALAALFLFWGIGLLLISMVLVAAIWDTMMSLFCAL